MWTVGYFNRPQTALHCIFALQVARNNLTLQQLPQGLYARRCSMKYSLMKPNRLATDASLIPGSNRINLGGKSERATLAPSSFLPLRCPLSEALYLQLLQWSSSASNRSDCVCTGQPPGVNGYNCMSVIKVFLKKSV